MRPEWFLMSAKGLDPSDCRDFVIVRKFCDDLSAVANEPGRKQLILSLRVATDCFAEPFIGRIRASGWLQRKRFAFVAGNDDVEGDGAAN
jgi:hypothetical protein